MTIKTHIYKEVEIPVEVSFTYWPPSRGSRDKFGVPLEPDYPAEIEVQAVLHDGEDILLTLSEEQIQRLEEECLKAHHDFC